MSESEAASQQSSGDQRSPEEIRKEIEETREQLGDTVEALAEKTDVKQQAKDRVAAAKETVQEKREQFAESAKQAAPASAREGAQQVAATVQRQPLPFATAGAFGAGLLIGWALRRR